jgi:hypothetical protein
MWRTIITVLFAITALTGGADRQSLNDGVNYCVNNAQACMNDDAQSQLNGIIAAIQTELSSGYDRSYAD